MNRQMKELLKISAGKPDQKRKDEFIRTYHRMEEMKEETTLRFIWSQIPYIRWYVWAVAVCVFAVAVVCIHLKFPDTTQLISSCMPFVSLIGIIESFRSKQNEMFELECVIKYSFRGIYFARISCIGAVHIFVILVLIIILGQENSRGYLLTGALLAIPYLLTAALNTKIERTILGRKSINTCVCVSAFVSVFMIFLYNQMTFLKTVEPWVWSVLLLAIVGANYFEIKEVRKKVSFS